MCKPSETAQGPGCRCNRTDTAASAGPTVLNEEQDRNIPFPRNLDTDASRICKTDADLLGLSLAGSACTEKQAGGTRQHEC